VSAAAAAVPATAVATTLAGELYAGRMCSGVFLVEDIKGRQADVENFFLAESDYVTRYSILLGYILGRTNNCRGCAARHG
jgi:hypothetical protein